MIDLGKTQFVSLKLCCRLVLLDCFFWLVLVHQSISQIVMCCSIGIICLYSFLVFHLRFCIQRISHQAVSPSYMVSVVLRKSTNADQEEKYYINDSI